jgi:maltose-binding protein MalE
MFLSDQGVVRGAAIRFSGMKKYIYILASLALLAACEQKETTVTNPPAEKKESNTTVINPPAQKKETTVVNPATETKKEEKTEVNINTSPSP